MKYKFLLLLNINVSYGLAKIPIKRLPELKKIDSKIYKLAKPATINYLMVPFLGLVDSFWVSQLGGAEKLAAQGCADQIYNTFYRMTDFYSPVIAPEVSILNARNQTEKISNVVSTSIYSTCIMTVILTSIILIFNCQIINFFVKGNTMNKLTSEYLKYRSLGLMFGLINSIIFSTLRGMLDFNSAIRINIKSQIFNIITDPILMYYYDLKGLALATVLSEVYCTIEYLLLLKKKNIQIQKFKNDFATFFDTIKKGMYVQVRSLCYNLLGIITNNKIISIDQEGKKVAAHILSLKIFDFGTILSNSMNSVTSILVSNERVFNKDKIIRKRLIQWSNVVGIFQFILFYNLRYIIGFFTNDITVINECVKISNVIAFYGYFSCVSSVLEGILQGYQKYRAQSLFAIFIFISINISNNFAKDLNQIWMSALVFTIVKCIGIFKLIFF